ncbi:MAG: glycerol kinase GlpK [Myxococcota bacterium]
MADLVLAIDQGTTGTTAMIVDRNVRVLASRNVEFPNHYPKPGWVEHDVEEIWTSVEGAIRGALHAAGVGADRIAAIGITNQRETSLFWDPSTGEAIHRALVWQDRRTADRCEALREQGLEELFRTKTGLVLDPYFSGTKAAWLLDHVPGARARAEAGAIKFGTIDSWLAWRLTGEHVTDPSNASRTLMMDLETGDWDPGLCETLDVPLACLPKIVDSSGVVGHTRGLSILPDGIPVAGLIGDQQGALFGQAAYEAGLAKCTYGTGAFVLLNTGSTPVASQHGMLTTVAWRLGGKTTYALEGSAFIAGAAVQWIRDGLGFIEHAAEIESLAASVPDSGGVVFVPALTGLGAPHWRPKATGLMTGITRGTTRAHLARAVLDGVALQLVDILQAMAKDLEQPLTELRVDGGASGNNLLMQRQADLLGVSCVRPVVRETTGLGSALLAGLATGVWGSVEEVSSSWQTDRRFEPMGDAAEIAATRAAWDRAVAKA